MYIRNKKTGLVQECHNEDVICICKKDTENYEVSETGVEVHTYVVREPQEIDLKKMKLDELKALAKEKGIDGCASLTKDELFAVLKEVA